MKSGTKKFLIALGIFVFVFAVMGLPYYQMGLDSDCLGFVFFTSQLKGFWQHVKYLTLPIQFAYESVNYDMATYTPTDNGGFLTYYRPVATLCHYICYALFGPNGYAYFLVNVGLHAATTSCLFYIYAFFLNYLTAGLLALLFAFHPAHVPAYVGVTCFIIPIYLFMAIAVIFFILHYTKRNYFYYFMAAFFYILALFCYEIVIVMPFVLVFYMLIFDRKNIIKDTWLFFAATIIYIATRYAFLGGIKANPVTGGGLKKFIFDAIFSWYQTVKPFWGMIYYSKLFVAAITLIFVHAIFYYIRHNKEKRNLMIFYLGGFLMCAWTIFLGSPITRYFYLAIPFFVLIMYEIVTFKEARVWRNKRISNVTTYFVFLSFLAWGISNSFIFLKNREFVTSKRDAAFKDLAAKYKGQSDLNFVFLGTVCYHNGDSLFMQRGMVQAAKIFFNNPKQNSFHVIEFKSYNEHAGYKTFNVTPLKNGFRFTSPDPEHLFVMCHYDWTIDQPIKFSLGEIIPHKKLDGWQTYDLSFTFDKKWLESIDIDKTIFLTFDTSVWKFVELDKRLIAEEIL